MGGTAGMSRFFCVQFGAVLLLLATVLPSRLTNISSWELLCLHGEGADDLQRRARAHGEAGRPMLAMLYARLSGHETLRMEVEGLSGSARFALNSDQSLLPQLLDPVRFEIIVGALSPASLEWAQAFLVWQDSRRSRLFHEATRSAGSPTYATVINFVLLKDLGLWSPDLLAEVDSMMLKAPEKAWGEVDIPLSALMLLSSRLKLSELGSVVERLTDVEGLRRASLLFQRYPQKTNELILLHDGFEGRVTQLHDHLERNGLRGVEDLVSAFSGNPQNAHFLAERGLLLRRRGSLALDLQVASLAPLVVAATQHFLWVGILRASLLCFGLLFLLHALVDLNLDHPRLSRTVWLCALTLTLPVLGLQEDLYFFNTAAPLEMNFSLPQINNLTENPVMDPETFSMATQLYSLIAIGIFFFLQAFFFLWGILQIQRIGSKDDQAQTKLKLLENEEHLFDMGLYVGLSGTVASLLLIAMNLYGPGLVSAYTSTLFGILEVAILKLFILRPVKRRLILEQAQAMV